MKKLILILALLFLPSLVAAQCNGVFPANTYCGNNTGSPGVPTPIPFLTFPFAVPQYDFIIGNSLGQGAATALSGDCIYGVSGIICTKTNGVAFGTIAQYNSPLPAINGGTGLASGTSGGIPYFSSSTTIASSSALGAGNILLGGGAGGAPSASGCTIDSNNNITCSSPTTVTPALNLVNTTSDGNPASIIFQKNRSGGNTNSSDLLGRIYFDGYANGAQQAAAEIVSAQAGASSGANIPSVIQLLTSNGAGLLNQAFVFNSAAHINISPASVPTTGNCGTGGGSVSGNDTFGTITTGSSATTSCMLTFAITYTSAPNCVVTPVGAANSGLYITPVTSSFTLTYTSATSQKFSYMCMGS